jgi:diguanylate cyclase (GGDEF)-like protein
MGYIKQLYKMDRKLFWFSICLTVLMPIITIILNLTIKDKYAQVVISDVSSPVYNLMATIALVFAAIYSKKISKRYAISWGILAFAQFSFTLGDILWGIIELGLKNNPFPSIADGPYLLFYPLFCLGVSVFPSKRFSTNEWIKNSLNICIIMVAAVLAYWTFLFDPLIQKEVGVSTLEFIITFAYPAGDLILLFAILGIIYYRSEQIIKGPMYLLGSSMLFMIVADSIFSYQSMVNTYSSGGILDLGWIFSYVFIGAAGIVQVVGVKIYTENRPLSTNILTIRKIISKGSSYLPYIWVIAAYILLIWQRGSNTHINPNILPIGVGIILALVILDQIIAINENDHLLSTVRIAFEEVKRQASELNESNQKLNQEIIERNRVEEKLIHDAFHDGLTGLANRVLFMDRLSHAIEFSKREINYHYDILYIDLDNFKSINDGLGHSFGDLALIEAARRISTNTRASDTVARFGGDEFVVLIENTMEDDAGITITKRIFSEFERPFLLNNKELPITCSIGIKQGITNCENSEEIIRDADIAMYCAKENGKARSEVFNLAMRKSALSRLEIEEDLRRAISNCEFTLNYQPIYSVRQNEIVGFEALVRWQHPKHGLLLPGVFIKIAEKSGLIIPLGDWVLQEACSQLKKWHIEFPDMDSLWVSVNISGKQIIRADFVDKVNSILSATGLDPNKLKLEITENVFIENQIAVDHILTKLRESGVTFMIDDFGTGYSSLGYLKNLFVSTIKIDKSFVDDILAGQKDLEIINTIILMAHCLGMDTIAEGIENSIQLEKLKSINCKYGQGYFLSKPITGKQIEAILDEREKSKLIEYSSSN